MSHKQVPCRACAMPMIWLPTRAGKAMPVDADSVKEDDKQFDHTRHVSHFATCPKAKEFRKPSRG